MKTIKKIVVATDFSENANTAYQYARHLATSTGANLHVIHVFTPPIPDSQQELYTSAPIFEELVEIANERLARFVSEETKKNDAVALSRPLKMTYKTYVGFSPTAIIDASKDPSVDLVVLGAKGSGNWFDRAIGSTADTVGRKAHCPVLIVPHRAKYKGIQRIIYAASGDSSRQKAIGTTLDWAKYFHASVHFVHIETPEERDFGKTDYLFALKADATAPSVQHTVETIKAPSILEGLKKYADKKAANLIVAVTKERSFWKRLTHHSTTHDLVWHNDLPLLIMHQDDHYPPPPHTVEAQFAHSL
jgi:nucleotide-binding universal stress UspA family protein